MLAQINNDRVWRPFLPRIGKYDCPSSGYLLIKKLFDSPASAYHVA